MKSTSDLDRQIAQLRRCEFISEAEVKSLCQKALEIFIEESNVQRVDTPVTVCVCVCVCVCIMYVRACMCAYVSVWCIFVLGIYF